MLSLLLSAMLVPPPPVGDDRTAILFHVRQSLDALLVSDEAAIRANFHADARFDVVDERPGKEGRTERRTLDQMMAIGKGGAKLQEPMGIPTVLQDGRYAQVWAPYSFWVDGKKSHCGVDNVTLVRSGASWKITAFGFTMVPVDRCAALAAPTVPDPSKAN